MAQSQDAKTFARSEKALRLCTSGLSALLAEMLALGAVMPGLVPSEAKTDEEEVEAAFDNMPV